MIDIYKELPRRIKVERAKNDMKQSDLAERLGINQCQVSHWEAGGNIPTLYYILKICEIFKISPNELLGWET